MAITTNAQAIQEINAALLVDGPNIKQLLLDLAAFLQSSGSLPAATTAAIGGVKEAANVAALTSVGPGTVAAGLVDVTGTPTQATINANFATLGTMIDAMRTAFVNAGQMVGP